MSRRPAIVRTLAGAGALALALALAGCGASRLDGPVTGAAGAGGATAVTGLDPAGVPTAFPGITLNPPALLSPPGRSARAWFPLVPGVYRDYKVTVLGVGVRYLRVTIGGPETFFGRTVVPWVYGAIPGMVPDTLLLELRQYYSYSPAGDLWFHGAENRGFASHTDPPVRQLLARPAPGLAWTDTVEFESFFPGGQLFDREQQSYAWSLSPLATLPLEGGTFRALRSAAKLTSLDGAARGPAAEARALAALFDPAAVPGDALPPRRGTWFAEHKGPVAIDWPSGPTGSFFNIATFEWIGQGVTALPPRRVVWEAAQAAVRMGPASVSAAGSSDSPVMRSGLRTRSSP